MSKALHADYVFNSALETGVRSACVLAADLSMQYDLQQLLAFDHLVVHTGDVYNAPSSLHPNTPQRNGELLVRRPLVEHGLLLMEHKKLIEKIVSADGFYYKATDLASVFIDSLTNSYIEELRERANWAVKMYKESGDEFISEVFNVAFGRWVNEFQIAEMSIGSYKGFE